MSRRRPTLRTYLRRRWRVAGGLVVLLLGGLLVLAIADRGHDPLWDVREPALERMAISPDGERVYVLVRGPSGNVARLDARNADDGTLLWKTDLDETSALVAAGNDGVAVATDIPRSALTYYDLDGGLRWRLTEQVSGTPRALRVDGGLVALALKATGNPVLVVDGAGSLVRSYRFPDLVRSMDLRAGTVAVGLSNGEAALYAPNGSLRLNMSFDISVDAVRLSRTGDQLILGGITRTTGSLAGAVAFLDLNESDPLRWMQNTSAGIGLVDLDLPGQRAMAVEQSADPGYALHVYDAESGVKSWSVVADGPIGRDDAAAFGGAALSPDGRHVVYATPLGDVRVHAFPGGDLERSYRAEGSTVVLFGDDPARFVVNARVVANGPIEAILLFEVDREPLLSNLAFLAALLATATVALGLSILGVGFWRVRRSY